MAAATTMAEDYGATLSSSCGYWPHASDGTAEAGGVAMLPAEELWTHHRQTRVTDARRIRWSHMGAVLLTPHGTPRYHVFQSFKHSFECQKVEDESPRAEGPTLCTVRAGGQGACQPRPPRTA